MKTNKKMISVTFSIAIILIVLGLILRLLECKYGYAIAIIGTMVGLVAFIFSSHIHETKNRSVKKQKWINVTYAVAAILIVLGLTLRLLEYKYGYAIAIIGIMIGLFAFIFSSYIHETKNKSGK
jgi:uncharacterized membrane protein